jgi:signal transduction histidine kinase
LDTSSAQRWCRDHSEALLTAAALVLIVVPTERSGPWATWVAIIAWLPLVVRTRWPLPVAAVVVVIDAVDIVVAAHGHPPGPTVPVATMLALYTVSLRSAARVAWVSALLAAAVQTVTALVSRDHHVGQALLYINWAIVATVIGRLVRERQVQVAAAEQRADLAERTKADEARRQVSDERIRIARELHDALAHHLTVVNAQAAVAQHLLRSDPNAAEKALTGITDNTRAALDDLRATLGLLRTDTDLNETGERTPTPSLDQISALVASFTDSGADVTVETAGTPGALSRSAEVALYRIAQEALTNATKHAPGAAVGIRLTWGRRTVVLTVVNAGSSEAGGNEEGSGHGLIGMRERAHAAGGTVSVGPGADGGYEVSATLPVSTTGPSRDQRDSAEDPSIAVGPRS